MKKWMIFGFIFVAFLVLTLSLASINAARIKSDSFRISNCIRQCTEYKKIDQKTCTSDYIINLNNCSLNYKTCLKQTKDRKACLNTFNECKKISSVDKKVCNNKLTVDFFNCKDKCLNPQFKCAIEGESIPVILSPPSCCQGLSLILPREENIIGISGICTSKCGNGICDITESSYNCASDCN